MVTTTSFVCIFDSVNWQREAQFFKTVLIFCIFIIDCFLLKPSKHSVCSERNGLFLTHLYSKAPHVPSIFSLEIWASKESLILWTCIVPLLGNSRSENSLCSVCPLYSLASTPLGWFKGPALKLEEWLVRKISSVCFQMAYVKRQKLREYLFMHLKITAYLLLNIWLPYSLLEKKLHYDLQWSFS